jgi:hypothetical protein
VATFQYLRLAGWPASSIALLTTYNGQKALLRDIVKRRCAPYGVFGTPGAVETVDKFQGQQADIVLLSLVRTRAVGHLRDVRRLTVAMSRARLGLYVFGRAALFANCLELQPTFGQLCGPACGGRPTQLQLLVGEQWPTHRPASDSSSADEDDAGGGGGGGAPTAATAAAAAALAAAAAASGGALVPVAVAGVEHLGAIVSRVLGAQMAAAAAAASAAAAAAAVVSEPPPPPPPPAAGGGGRRGPPRPTLGDGAEELDEGAGTRDGGAEEGEEERGGGEEEAAEEDAGADGDAAGPQEEEEEEEEEK